MTVPAIPRAQSQMVRTDLAPRAEWFNFLSGLRAEVESNSAAIAQLGTAPATADTTDASGSLEVQGEASVVANGVCADGLVRLSLANDVEAPDAFRAYATDGNGTKGWLDIGYTAPGTGGVARLPSEKALELPSPQDYGAAGDGATDDTAAVADAIAEHDEILLTLDHLVTALSNTKGVRFRGRGRILKAITGGLQQLNSDADDYQHIFGMEYLDAFYSKLEAGTTATMLFSGDSTTEGGVGHATGTGLIDQVVLNLGLDRGHKLTVTNAGHSGKHTEEWRTLYLPTDLAASPDLMVIRWGINDPYYGRSVEDFKTSLRTGLATIRASKTLAQMAILLMVPNSTSDTPNDRDEKRYEQVRRIVRQAARDYQCCCIDTYALLRDSRPAAGLWMDDPFADGRAIHPKNRMNRVIGSFIARAIFPEGLDPAKRGTYTPTLTLGANVASASVPNPWQWFRVGDMVTVFGRVDIACTAAADTLTILKATLPVASDFAQSSQLSGGGGIGQTNQYPNFLCLADATNNLLQMQFGSKGTASAGAWFKFSYRVV